MIWNPQRLTLLEITDNLDPKESFKYFRNSSSAFIKNKKVRNFILKRDKNKCVICNSTDFLEIDHIKSVFSCFNSGEIFFCNSIDNLQCLCKKCNTSKKP